MKRIGFTILCTIAFLLLGCNKNVDIDGQEEDCLLVLKMGGEIEVSEAPLSKSQALDDLYLLQVYRTSGQNQLPWASGVFDDLSNLKVFLKKDINYTIIVSLIKNGKSILNEKEKYSYVNNSICMESMTTLKNQTDGVVKKDKSDSDYNYNVFAWSEACNDVVWLAVNELVYNDYDNQNRSKKGIRCYATATSTQLLKQGFQTKYKVGSETYQNSVQPEFVNIGLTNPYNYTYKSEAYKGYYQCNDWFYGKITITPTGTMEHQTVELKRVGFQLQLDPVIGITDGSVSVKIILDGKTLISETYTDESTESIGPLFFTYPDADLVWSNADGYEETSRVSVIWHRGLGVDQDFGSINVNMKRNMLNHVKITVKTDDSGSAMNMVVESDGGEGDTIDAIL